jgi:hypothetical protein
MKPISNIKGDSVKSDIESYFSIPSYDIPAFIKTLVDFTVRRSFSIPERGIVCEILFHDNGYIEFNDNSGDSIEMVAVGNDGYVPGQLFESILELTETVDLTVKNNGKVYNYSGNYNESNHSLTEIGDCDGGDSGILLKFKFLPKTQEGLRYVEYSAISNYLRQCALLNSNVNFILSYKKDGITNRLGFLDIYAETLMVPRSHGDIFRIKQYNVEGAEFNIYFSLREILSNKVEINGIDGIPSISTVYIDEFYEALLDVIAPNFENTGEKLNSLQALTNFNLVIECMHDVPGSPPVSTIGDLAKLREQLLDISESPDFADVLVELMDRINN